MKQKALLPKTPNHGRGKSAPKEPITVIAKRGGSDLMTLLACESPARLFDHAAELVANTPGFLADRAWGSEKLDFEQSLVYMALGDTKDKLSVREELGQLRRLVKVLAVNLMQRGLEDPETLDRYTAVRKIGAYRAGPRHRSEGIVNDPQAPPVDFEAKVEEAATVNDEKEADAAARAAEGA